MVSHGTVTDPNYTFPERPPHRVLWRTWTGFEFETLGMHADPDNVEFELNQLGLAAADAVEGGRPVLVMGDLNADCSYLTASEWQCIRASDCIDHAIALWDNSMFGAANWLIGDEADTTVAATDCAYDRLVLSDDLLPRALPGSAATIRFDCALGLNASATKLVSDHYPVAVTLNVSMTANDPARPFNASSGGNYTTDGGTAGSPTVLVPGDVAVVMLHSDNDAAGLDGFAAVLLVPVAPGTTVTFTDAGWNCEADAFRAGEGRITWTAVEAHAAGAVLRYPEDGPGHTWNRAGSFGLSADGEQLYAYQGSAAAPVFLWAITYAAAGWQSEASSTTTGCLPQPLVSDGTFVTAAQHSDNLVYAGTVRNATRSVLLGAIANFSLWATANDPFPGLDTHLEGFGVLADPTAAPSPAPTMATQVPTPTPTPAPGGECASDCGARGNRRLEQGNARAIREHLELLGIL